MNAPNKLEKVDYDALRREGKGIIEAMGANGDTKTIWDPNKPEEVEVAKASFDALKKKGYIAFKVDDSGNKGEIINTFDPQAGRVILAPPLAGG